MKSLLTRIVPLLMVAAFAGAQQPNSVFASLRFNGADGPPYPINPVSLTKGIPSSFVLNGLPNAPFIVAGSGALATGGVSFNGGVVDLNLTSSFSIALNGLTDPFWTLGPGGDFPGTFVIASSTPTGASRCWQALIADFTNPAGATLSAATRTVVVPGVTTIPQSIGSNSYTLFSLAPYQTSIPFYSQTYTQFYINQDGFLSFNSANGDFTPTDTEMLSQFPRIAGCWTDLEPGGSSVIDVQIDQSVSAVTVVTVRYLQMLEYLAGGSPHSFMIRMFSGSGDIRIINSNFNNPAQYDMLVGISPGGLSASVTTYPWTNLGSFLATPFAGGVNQPIYEWFGNPSFPYYTPGLTPPFVTNNFDLTGHTISFNALGAGTSQARYSMQAQFTQGF